MVRLAIVTVGAADGEPIVTTGPPPLIDVAAAATPTRLTLFVIVRPPANVPGPTRTVSPSCAALTAACTVTKQWGPPTHSVLADRPEAATARATTHATPMSLSPLISSRARTDELD